MVCPQCGVENPRNAASCTACGAALLPRSQTRTPNTHTPPQQRGLPAHGTEEATISLEDWQHERKAAPSNVLPAGLEIGRRYRVVRLLGQGGMGAVYQVYDKELERDVALKLIRPELGADSQVLARFKREIQLSSQVTHPNVLRVFDVGESGGTKFLTMQFVEGEDLATKLKRDGRLPLADLLDKFRQICQGLAAAHKQGVTHRDLKPHNIMIDRRGQVYLMDFGLAKSSELGSMTQSGTMLGTPYYMSPEQVKGEKVDARSDIYSLGVILYEMAAGEVPFSGLPAYEAMAQRLQHPPRPIKEINPDLPAYLEKILEKCLAVDKELRYSSADEILADLDRQSVGSSVWYEVRKRPWLRYALIALAVLIVGWGIYRTVPVSLFHRGGEVALKQPEIQAPILGVASFTVRSEDANANWYGPGLARLVADNLAGSRNLRIVSMARMEMLEASSKTQTALIQTAAKGGIKYLLTGEILAGQGGLTLSTRLIDTSNGEQITARRMDNLSQEKALKSADEIAMEVRRGLNLPLTKEVDVYAADFASKNPRSYECYVSGLRSLTRYKYDDAEKWFREALRVSPDFTMARYRLATVLMTTSRADKAVEEFRRAQSEVSRLPSREGTLVLAAAAWCEGQDDRGIHLLQELLTKYPYETEARYLLANLYEQQERYSEELEQLRLLAQLEPDLPIVWSMLGSSYIKTKDFNQAVLALKRYSKLAPDNANGPGLLGDCYQAQGELDLALAQYKKAWEKDAGYYWAPISIATVLVLKEDSAEAERLLSQVIKDSKVMLRLRLDAAFDLAYLYRAEGQFSRVEGLLAPLKKELAAEQVRESLGFVTRGLSLVELGDMRQAERLLNLAVEESPGPATRYLFARGLLQLKRGKFDTVRETARTILKDALPPENPDRTEEKAAAYLTGLAYLSEKDPANAVDEISRSVTLSGYEYTNYHYGLAQAYLAAGRLEEALAAANKAGAALDPADPRLDLELDRIRARLLKARIYQAQGRLKQASDEARSFLSAWDKADRGLPELAEARRLAQIGQ